MNGKRWRWYDKLGGAALLVLLIFGGFWASISSSMFLPQDSMAIVQDEDGTWTMISVRRTPWGPVSAAWNATYRVVGREEGLSCVGEGYVRYEPVPGDLVRYELGAWAWPCLDAGPPTSVSYERRVYLAGIIPLRSARYSFTINPETAPVVQNDEASGQPTVPQATP